MNDIAKQLQAAQREYQKKRAVLLSKVQEDFAVSLKAALKLYKSIPGDARSEILSGAKFTKLLGAFGAAAKAKPAREQRAAAPQAGKKGITVSPETEQKILAFLTIKRTTAEIMKHLKKSLPTVLGYMKALLRARKVSTHKEAKTPYWTKP